MTDYYLSPQNQEKNSNIFGEFIVRAGTTKIKISPSGGLTITLLERGRPLFGVDIKNKSSRIDVSGVRKYDKFQLSDIVFTEDYPRVSAEIAGSAGKCGTVFKTSFRFLGTNNAGSSINKNGRMRFFGLACECFIDALGVPYFIGYITDITYYMEKLSPRLIEGEQGKLKDDNGEVVSSETTEIEEPLPDLSESRKDGYPRYPIEQILGPEFLNELLTSFHDGTKLENYHIVLYDENDILIAPKPRIRKDMIAGKRTKKFRVRIMHSHAGTVIVYYPKNADLEKVNTLGRIYTEIIAKTANPLVLLFNEKQNAVHTGKMLAENNEQQILINSVYSSILKTQDSSTALMNVFNIIGKSLRLDKIYVTRAEIEETYSGKKERYKTYYEWVSDEKYYRKNYYPNEIYIPDSQVKWIERHLEYTDIFVSQGEIREMSAFGIKNFVLCGLIQPTSKLFGYIMFERREKDTMFRTVETKTLHMLTQIISTLILREQSERNLGDVRAELKKLTYTDASLGIPNRVKLERDLIAALTVGVQLTETEKSAIGGTLLSMKLTNLRLFDDLFGANYSEMILKLVVDFLFSFNEYSPRVYRSTENIFNILLPEYSDEGKVELLLREIKRRFEKPWKIKLNEHYLEYVMGATVFPIDNDNPADIIRRGSLAMYRAGEYGTNRYAFFSRKIEKNAATDYYWHQSLRRSVEENMAGFGLVYQPVVTLETGAINMAEVFSVWTHNGETLPPLKLVRMLESMGLENELDTRSIWHALRLCAKIREEINPFFQIHVNVTVRGLETGSFATVLRKALDELKLPPTAVSVDLPVGVFLSNGKLYESSRENMMTAISKIKKLGVILAIDGYGNEVFVPNLLKNSYIDAVKADYSLFSEIYSDYDKIILEASIKIALTLENKNSVISGLCVKRIERPEQLEVIKKYGAKYALGYLFSKPVPKNELLKLIAH